MRLPKTGLHPTIKTLTDPKAAPERLRWGVILCGLLVLFAVTIGAAVRTAHKVNAVVQSGSPLEINDFDRWLRLMPAHLVDHADITDERSTNTVLDLLLLAPFTHLSRLGAHVVWTQCKPCMVILIALAAFSMVEATGVTLNPPCIGLIFAAWLWPIIGDIQEGQTNLLMLLPLTVGLWAAQREERQGFIWLAGLLIALAIAIKVTPLVFLPYFLWRRRWKLAIGIAAGMVVWFVLVPSLAFGWQQNLRWQSQWFGVMILPYMRGDVRVVVGESIPSFLTKLLRSVPAFTSYKSGQAVEHYMNIANLSAWAVGWIVRTVLGALVVGGAFWMRRRLESFRTARFVLEIGSVGAFMLWASHWTLVAHYVSLLLPLCAVGLVASSAAFPAGVRRGAMVALALAALLMFLTSDVAKAIAGPDGREYMLMINVCLMAALALVVSIVVASRHERKGSGCGP